MKIFEILESTSELKLRVHGESLEKLFANALFAMFQCIEPVFAKNARKVSQNIAVSAMDRDQLLVDFLSTALTYSDTKNLAFHDVRFESFCETSLKATLRGKKIESFAVEIKAVTYHGVHIKEHDQRFSCELIFDI